VAKREIIVPNPFCKLMSEKLAPNYYCGGTDENPKLCNMDGSFAGQVDWKKLAAEFGVKWND